MSFDDRNRAPGEQQFEEAAEWLSVTESGRFEPKARRELDCWLAADSRHARAFSRMQYILMLIGEVDLSGIAADVSEPEDRGRTGFSF